MIRFLDFLLLYLIICGKNREIDIFWNNKYSVRIGEFEGNLRGEEEGIVIIWGSRVFYIYKSIFYLFGLKN